MKIRVPIFVVFCAFGCTSLDQNDGNSQSDFFSMSDFIDVHLQTSDSLSDVVKTITVDGSSERKQIDQYDITRDIRGFSTLDINRPALWEKYQVDTITSENGETVTYHALSEDLAVRTIEIVIANEQIRRIGTIKHSKTFLADVRTEYNWTPKEGYTILRDEKRLFAEPSHHQIKVELQP